MIWEAKVIKNTVIIFFRGGGDSSQKKPKVPIFSIVCEDTVIY